MWIFTTHGFVSIVQHNGDPEMFQVKSRTPRPLEKFWPKSDIEVIKWADYRYRISIKKGPVIEALGSILRGLEYTSFKSQCEDSEEYHWTLVQTWGLLNELQISHELGRRSDGIHG